MKKSHCCRFIKKNPGFKVCLDVFKGSQCCLGVIFFFNFAGRRTWGNLRGFEKQMIACFILREVKERKKKSVFLLQMKGRWGLELQKPLGLKE